MNGNKPLYKYDNAKHVKGAVNAICERIKSALDSYGGVLNSDCEISEVETEHVSGFIPFTDGAYDCLLFVMPETLNTYAMNRKLSADIKERCKHAYESDYLECIKSALDERELNTKLAYSYVDGTEEIPGDIEEAAQEIMSDCEPLAVRVQAIYHEHPDALVRFFVSINFDAPYYRESIIGSKHKCQYDVATAAVPLAEAAEERLTTLVNELLEGLA